MLFTDKLKALTDDAHQDAEQSVFITRLLQGEESAAAYARLVTEYLPLYDGLEHAARATRQARPMSEFFDARLERTPALRSDLAVLGVSDPAPPLPATSAYVDRIASFATDEPVRVLAHHYLRYLGDLSGGQVIGRLVQRHYGIPDDALRVWDFSAVGKSKPYKDAYRDKLNICLSASEQDVFVEECLHGYRLARELFEDLAAAPVG
ncbi:heme oxygenase (biliverdin-producing) [Blastococcus sp. Marseille-P5729]|uniref:biliverdin-producing heme oxygenase n=1 Tax=Blastococcus sp. Marseille-P5729 TaxID=2086582 RepID=UPI000D0E58D5|nr:biliverdin-producing heme oxygenase [Blastococcus sp. Marseille-P5729]